jgi:hypothetical protein
MGHTNPSFTKEVYKAVESKAVLSGFFPEEIKP